MVSNEVFRGRYRSSFDKPEPITPNAVLEYSFSLHTQNHAFRKGHRLMVQVQSRWVLSHRQHSPDLCPEHLRGERERPPCGATPVYRLSRYPSRVASPWS